VKLESFLAAFISFSIDVPQSEVRTGEAKRPRFGRSQSRITLTSLEQRWGDINVTCHFGSFSQTANQNAE
jgi:hypothetical protein